MKKLVVSHVFPRRFIQKVLKPAETVQVFGNVKGVESEGAPYHGTLSVWNLNPDNGCLIWVASP